MSPRSKEQSEQIRTERQAQILDAAWHVFGRKGFHSTKVSDIASQAGVSQGTIYWYFPSKDELFLSLFEQWLERLDATFGQIDAIETTATEKVHLYGQAIARFMLDARPMLPVLVEFWTHAPHNETVCQGFRQLFARYRTDWSRVIGEGIVAGEFREEVNAEHLVSVTMAVADGLVLQWLVDPQAVDWEAIVASLVDIILRGIARR